jgi:hypothetical protein
VLRKIPPRVKKKISHLGMFSLSTNEERKLPNALRMGFFVSRNY